MKRKLTIIRNYEQIKKKIIETININESSNEENRRTEKRCLCICMYTVPWTEANGIEGNFWRLILEGEDLKQIEDGGGGELEIAEIFGARQRDGEEGQRNTAEKAIVRGDTWKTSTKK